MKKKIALTMAAVIAATMVTACGGGSKAETGAATKEETKQESEEVKHSEGSAEESYVTTTTDNQKAVLEEVTEALKNADKSFSAENIQERNLVFWDRMGEEHIMGRTALAFYYALQELSEGKITADLYLSGEIDVDSTNLPEAYSVMDVGRYQLELAAQNGYAKGAVFGLPYVFQNREHFWNFAESDFGKQVIDEINNGGFACHVLSYTEEGARSYFTNEAHPISSYEDLTGLKLRVQSSDIYNGMVSAVGASPTAMAWSEVYTGISSGVVDGAENPYTGYNSAMLYEVAPNVYEDEHIWGACLLSVSTSVWNDLNDDEKAMFECAAKIASDYNKRNIQEAEAEIKETIVKEHGVTIVTPTAEEKQALIDMCKPVYEKYAPDYLDVIDEIAALAK